MIRYTRDNRPPQGSRVVITEGGWGRASVGEFGTVSDGEVRRATGGPISLGEITSMVLIRGTWRQSFAQPNGFRDGSEVIVCRRRGSDYAGHGGTLYQAPNGEWKVRVTRYPAGGGLHPAVNLRNWGEIALVATAEPEAQEPEQTEQVHWTHENLPPDGAYVRAVIDDRLCAPGWIVRAVRRQQPVRFVAAGSGGLGPMSHNRINVGETGSAEETWASVTENTMTGWHMEPLDQSAVTEPIDYKARLDALWEALAQQAEDRNWCDEYDEFARKHDGPPRGVLTTYAVRVRARTAPSNDAVEQALRQGLSISEAHVTLS